MFLCLYITNVQAQKGYSKPSVEHIFAHVSNRNYDSAKTAIERLTIKDIERSYTTTTSPRSSSFSGKKPPGLLSIFLIPFVIIDALIPKGGGSTITHRETLLEYTVSMSDPSSERLAFIEYLLKRGANPNKKNGDKTPIAIAASKRYDNEIVKLLYRYGADPTLGNNNNSALNIALEQNNKELINFFIKSKVQFPSSYSGTSIMASAFASGDIDMINMMLASNVSFDSPRLIEKATDIIKDNKTKINDSTYVAVIDKLVANNFDANETEKYSENLPLHYALENKCEGMAVALIPHTKNLNHMNRWGKTPLMMAAENANYKAIDKLMANGAELEIKNDKGKTARDLAIDKNYYSIADHLENKSPETKERSRLLAYLLINDTIPKQQKNDSAIGLIQAGVSLNACRIRSYMDSKRYYHYNGPSNFLHFAVLRGNHVIAEELLKAGADPNAKDPIDKNIPLHYIFSNGDTNMARLLINHGADLHSPLVKKDLLWYDKYSCESSTWVNMCLTKNMFRAEIIKNIVITKNDIGWYYANRRTGNNLFWFHADSILPFDRAGYSIMMVDKKWGVMDLFGDQKLAPIYEEVGPFERPGPDPDLLILRTFYNGRWSIKFMTTNYTLDTYESMSPFIYGKKRGKQKYAIVSDKGKFGVIDGLSKIIIEMKYDNISQDKKGKLWGTLGGEKSRIKLK